MAKIAASLSLGGESTVNGVTSAAGVNGPTQNAFDGTVNGAANPDVNAQFTTNGDINAVCDDMGPLPKSTGVHAAQFALGPGRAD